MFWNFAKVSNESFSSTIRMMNDQNTLSNNIRVFEAVKQKLVRHIIYNWGYTNRL